MGPNAFLAVGVGATLGAWLRWGLGLWLNPIFSAIPLGTLIANLVGGYLIGIATGVFAQSQTLPPEIRLLVVTGFLGGLTTFSTFSAEAVALLSRQQFGWAATHVSSHLVGSLAATMLGIITVNYLRA